MLCYDATRIGEQFDWIEYYRLLMPDKETVIPAAFVLLLDEEKDTILQIYSESESTHQILFWKISKMSPYISQRKLSRIFLAETDITQHGL